MVVEIRDHAACAEVHTPKNEERYESGFFNSTPDITPTIQRIRPKKLKRSMLKQVAAASRSDIIQPSKA